MTRALEYRVGSPLGLLAVAVIGLAMQDRRDGFPVEIGAYWLQLADVDERWLTREGVSVDSRLNLRWRFG
jgi:hypothetical protein